MKQPHFGGRLSRGLLVAGLGVLLAIALFQPAAASPITWLSVKLGSHRFGHLSKPDAIVAKAKPTDVGFDIPPNGEGPVHGPWSFDVARDGSVWLMDQFNDRLVVWSKGRPGRPARVIPLPPAPVDFALGRHGAVYVISMPPGERGYLYALTSAGRVRWKERTISIETFNSQLRMGPDGTLYYFTFAEHGWVPLATPAGRPVPLAEQRRRATPYQPLTEDLRLTSAAPSIHEVRFSLIDRANRVVRAWRVTGRDWVSPTTVMTTAMVGGDPVVGLEVLRETEGRPLYEYLVLRLGPTGGTRVRLTLDPHVIDGDVPITGLRVGPDGRLYQLRTSPNTGASIARYSLGSTEVAPPKPFPTPQPTTGGAIPPSSPPTEPRPSVTLPSATQPPVTQPSGMVHQVSASPVQNDPGRIAPALALLGMTGLLSLSGWLLHRRRAGRAGMAQ